MKKILYVHGLGSGADSSTSKRLANYFKDDEIYTVELSMDKPYECKKKIAEFVKKNGIDIIIGSSMGGFFSMQVKGITKILINPCLSPCSVLPQIIKINEPQEYLSKRRDGEKYYTITDKSIEDYRSIEKDFFTNALDDKAKAETYLILGTEDKVITAPQSLALIARFNESHIRKIQGMEHRASADILPVTARIIGEN